MKPSIYARILGLNEAQKSIDRDLETAQIQISDSAALVVWEGPETHCQHLAFAVTTEQFDAIFQRVPEAGIRYGNATDGFGEPFRVTDSGPDQASDELLHSSTQN